MLNAHLKIVLQGLKLVRLEISGGGTILRCVVLESSCQLYTYIMLCMLKSGIESVLLLL